MTIDQSYPCPKCGEHGLVYEGMLVWRHGSRPPRNLARKNIRLLGRADYERERIYHCEHCGAEFYEDVEQRSPHLYEEGGRGRYSYNSAHRCWQIRVFDKAEKVWKTKLINPKN